MENDFEMIMVIVWFGLHMVSLLGDPGSLRLGPRPWEPRVERVEAPVLRGALRF